MLNRLCARLRFSQWRSNWLRQVLCSAQWLPNPFQQLHLSNHRNFYHGCPPSLRSIVIFTMEAQLTSATIVFFAMVAQPLSTEPLTTFSYCEDQPYPNVSVGRFGFISMSSLPARTEFTSPRNRNTHRIWARRFSYRGTLQARRRPWETLSRQR